MIDQLARRPFQAPSDLAKPVESLRLLLRMRRSQRRIAGCREGDRTRSEQRTRRATHVLSMTNKSMKLVNITNDVQQQQCTPTDEEFLHCAFPARDGWEGATQRVDTLEESILLTTTIITTTPRAPKRVYSLLMRRVDTKKDPHNLWSQMIM